MRESEELVTQERRRLQEAQQPERSADLAWIEENRALFWLSATVAFEEHGHGVLMVDLISESPDRGHFFSYYAEGELELEDPDLCRYLRDYDPDREFIVVLLKPGGNSNVYCERRPLLGWETNLRTQTPYQRMVSK